MAPQVANGFPAVIFTSFPTGPLEEVIIPLPCRKASENYSRECVGNLVLHGYAHAATARRERLVKWQCRPIGTGTFSATVYGVVFVLSVGEEVKLGRQRKVFGDIQELL